MLETHYECPCLDKCPLNYAMSIIGGKWKMQIICALNNRGTLRYNELRRKMDGISNTVLASSLRELIRTLAGYPNLLIDVAKSYDPSRMTHYATELATAFHKFYNSCRVADENEALMQARGLPTVSDAAQAGQEA